MIALRAWLLAFALTELVEVPIYRVALRPRRGVRAWGLAALPSALTHPLVWFAAPLLRGGASYLAMTCAAELLAVVVEAALLRALGVRRALLWSVVANGSSTAVGLTLRMWIGVP